MTTIKTYRNKRNPNKYLEVHNDGHYHNSLKQYMFWSKNLAGRIAAGSKLRPLVHTIMKERKLPRTAKKRKDKEKIPFRSGENDRLRDMEKSRPER